MVAPSQQNEVREKDIFGSVAAFSDVYDVSAPEFHHFRHLPARLHVELVFKAKKVTFRERKTQNGEKLISVCS